MASSEQAVRNSDVVRRVYDEVLNEGRLEILDELAVPDHVEHNPFPQQSQGVEGLKQRASMVRAAFNPHFTIEHLIADDDKVAVIWSNKGTHVGEWFGFAPTGKTVEAHGVDVYLLRDGRLVEKWNVVDASDFFISVGLIPGRLAAAAGGR